MTVVERHHRQLLRRRATGPKVRTVPFHPLRDVVPGAGRPHPGIQVSSFVVLSVSSTS